MTIRTINAEPLGVCMYCGDDKAPLTDEHVMPRGLNGELVLPKSSCAKCQKMIGLFEAQVLKSGWLSDPRLVLGLRSYKPKRQPDDITMTFIGRNEKHFKKLVPKGSAIAMISMPGLIVPRYLTDNVPLSVREGMEMDSSNDALVYRGLVENVEGIHSVKLNEAKGRLCQRYNASGMKFSVQIAPPLIIRFLCKIAHGFHVLERGLFPLKESPALALLKSERFDYSNWVGSAPVSTDSEQRTSLHKMTIEDVTTKSGLPCTVVNIALFNSLGPNFNYVVVTRAVGWQEHVANTPTEPRAKGVIHWTTRK